MSVAKVIELTSDSETSFDDALRQGIRKAAKTLSGIKGAWIADQEVMVENGEVQGYRVHFRVTFVLD